MRKNNVEKDRGLIQIYTGNGKGKTTAALGLAVRAVGCGLKVCIVQFMKNQATGESKILKKLQKVEFYQFGSGTFIKKPVSTKASRGKDIKIANEALEFVRKKIQSKKYDLIILDEINIALFFKLIQLEQIIELIQQKPAKLELVLTGRKAPAKLIQMADLVTEMKKIKHPFDKGLKARKGIEY